MAEIAENVVVNSSLDHHNKNDELNNNNSEESESSKSYSSLSESKTELDKNINKLADILSKLNPWAQEFIPSSYRLTQFHDHQLNPLLFFPTPIKNSPNPNFPDLCRRRNALNQGTRRVNGRSFKAQREESVTRTVYVSDIDQQITEERLAALFSSCGQVVDCRICGDPHSVLRFAFVEFADDHGARAALSLSGTVLGYYPVRVLPSKTAILL